MSDSQRPDRCSKRDVQNMKVLHVRFASWMMAMALSCLIFVISTPANADVAGCDPAKYRNMQDIATVQVGCDLGTLQTLVQRLDTVVGLSCWPEAAQTSAESGGAIFSGNFKADLNGVIDQMVGELLGQFAGTFLDSLPGGMGGIIGGWFGFGAGTFSCDRMSQLFSDVQSRGLNQDAEDTSLTRCLSIATGANPFTGAPAAAVGPGSMLDENLGPIAGVAANVAAALTAAPPPVPNYTGAITLCEVMFRATGAVPPGCP